MAARTRNASRTKSRRGSQQRDPDGTRQALLGSALALFERLGYDATSVQQIVDDANRTKGAFYHHWESKEACSATCTTSSSTYSSSGRAR